MSLGDAILACEDLPVTPFPCPEWPTVDGKLFIRPLSGTERLEWEQCFAPVEKRTVVLVCDDPRSLVCGKAMVDGFGGPAFSNEQLLLIGAKNGAVIDRAYDAVLKLSKIRVSAETFDADRKNSEATPGKDSSTGSR